MRIVDEVAERNKRKEFYDRIVEGIQSKLKIEVVDDRSWGELRIKVYKKSFIPRRIAEVYSDYGEKGEKKVLEIRIREKYKDEIGIVKEILKAIESKEKGVKATLRIVEEL